MTAAEWYLRLGEDDLSEAELAAWIEWSRDSGHLAEFERVRAMSAALAEVAPAVEPGRRVAPRPAWIAAGMALVAVAIGFAILDGRRARPDGETGATPETIVAAASAARTAVLPDGSSLVLAPRTAVTVAFADARRLLTLSPGEAYFAVAHDRQRPFVVQAGGTAVTAVGTAFSVRSEPNRLTVDVREGVVDVAGAGVAGGPAHWRLTAGQQITYDPRTHEVRIAAIDMNAALSWVEGRLQYRHAPLAAVAADVSRYSDRAVVVDPDVGTLEFTGTVFTDAVDDWLRAVEATFPVRVLGDGAGQRRIERRTGPAAGR
jgi:transmembrane sensor